MRLSELNAPRQRDSENKSQVKSITIKGLFGEKDLKIPFEKDAMVLIGDNGSGKTTILKIIYGIFSGNFIPLFFLKVFDLIVVDFFDNKTIEFTKSDVQILEQSGLFYRTWEANKMLNILVNSMSINDWENIQKARQDFSEENIKFYLIKAEKRLQQMIQRKELIENTLNKLQEYIKESILYFPTYRRIEEDLTKLGLESKVESPDEGSQLVNFGMNDVIQRFERITKILKDSIKEIFDQFTGKMLTYLVEIPEVTEEMRKSIKPETLSIVLSRIRENDISSKDKEKIIELVKSGDINQKEYNNLVYSLYSLLMLYEQQQERESVINNFTEICNKYLRNKQIIYDQATINIYIKNTKTNQPIELRNLSSGEKQIISLFSKVYLEEYPNNFIVLFDEPELSLSLEWQKMLLPDILKSGKCNLLIAATHSPFIFDNELDFNAYDLDDFVVESENQI